MNEESKKDIKEWYAKTIEFEGICYKDVKDALILSINEHGFLIRKNDQFEKALNIQIIPYMELFDSEEIGGLTQTMDERATDEYFGTKKIYSILNELDNKLEIPVTEGLAEIDMGKFAKDTVLALLVYPLDGYKSSRSIHKPPASLPPLPSIV